MYKPLVLVIMDGVGLSVEEKGNAVAMAKLPNLRKISQIYPGTALQAAGLTVGIPWGEVGNSEVGHTAIGSGSIMYQYLSQINQSIASNEFSDFEVWRQVIDHANKNQSAVHLVGLLSNGGVHSHYNHLFAILKLLADKKFTRQVFIHIFTDGRDAPIQSAPTFIEELNNKIKELKIGTIASVCGRYYAMDRDQRWERTQAAYESIALGKGDQYTDVMEAINNAYNNKKTDEFIEPSVIVDENKQSIGPIKDGDAVVFFNFRPDRARQLTAEFIKYASDDKFLLSMTQYDEQFKIPVVFKPENVLQPLAGIISSADKKQLHITETEKYAHVTYFFNGGREKPFPGEDRILISSPKVDSYDKKPEMGAYEITQRLIVAIKENKYDFIVVNFANGDMVGHTGNLTASIKAMETVDECIGAISKEVLDVGGALIITADHGNCEEMINPETGQIDTEHSVNPVPLWLVTKDRQGEGAADMKINIGGILPDVAPTILELLELAKPQTMIGNSLLGVIFRQPI
ncbi:MAG: 2,3-bisphosphoglycerate-independent phosphoglycerate mutase [bacterium]|nr:2,3-bisphosphoglycerate-independent phosphoglycerate mutase [bacterium]